MQYQNATFGKGLPKKEEIAFVNNDKSYISEQLFKKTITTAAGNNRAGLTFVL